MKFLIFLLLLPLAVQAKVYDCFMFNHELEILEIRLHELDPYVDYFVLVEWNREHRTGNLKPYYFEENKERFAEFLPKIIHIKLDENFEAKKGSWAREHWHRNQMMRGLTQCKPNDTILISDVDEIPPGNVIPLLAHPLKSYKEFGFWHALYQWYLNRYTGYVWSGTVAVKYKDLIRTSPQEIRTRFRTIENLPRWQAGWHFSSMGGYERMREKYYQATEGSNEYRTYEEWLEMVQELPLVPIDSTYPKWVQENIDYLIEQDLIDVSVN